MKWAPHSQPPHAANPPSRWSFLWPGHWRWPLSSDWGSGTSILGRRLGGRAVLLGNPVAGYLPSQPASPGKISFYNKAKSIWNSQTHTTIPGIWVLVNCQFKIISYGWENFVTHNEIPAFRWPLSCLLSSLCCRLRIVIGTVPKKLNSPNTWLINHHVQL